MPLPHTSEKSIPEPIYQYFGPDRQEGAIIEMGDARDAYRIALRARNRARSAGNKSAILKEDGATNAWFVWIDDTFSEGYGLGLAHGTAHALKDLCMPFHRRKSHHFFSKIREFLFCSDK